MPNWIEYLRENLSLPEMKGHKDERALAEMADHLDDLYSEAISSGLDEEAAKALVLEWLGDPLRATEELTRAEPHHARAAANRWVERREADLRLRGGIGARIADGLGDLRTGLRALARRPMFTGVVVLVLALGIGAASAIFTLVDAIILSPLPFENAERLVAVQHAAPGRGLTDAGQSAAWHFTYEDESRAFEHLGMFSAESATVTGTGSPEVVGVLRVTDGVLRAVGVVPTLGRIFAADDMDPDGQSTLMLGNGYWQTRFGGDPAVVGQTLTTDGVTREIIGVAPPEVSGLGSDPDLIIPLRFRRSQLFVGNIGYDAVGRLRDGVTLEEAAADLNKVLPMAWEKFPGGPVASSSDPSQYIAEVYPLKDDIVGGVADLLWILLGSVGVLLMIACANVANLFLVRADGKDGEMAVRAAMGASSRRIGWEYMKESVLLGVMGGLGGLFLAQVGLRSLLALAPTNLPRMEEVTLDTTVLAFTLFVSVGSGIFFGLFPMLRQARADVVSALKAGARGGVADPRRNRTQQLLAISQISLAVVLLVASGLMVRSFQSLRNVDPGFTNAEEILSIRLFIPGREVSSSAEMATTYEAIIHSLEEINGVTSVGLGTGIPMDGGDNVNPFFVRGQVLDPDGPRISRRHKWITEGYFETLGIPVQAGRAFTWDDIHERAPVAILSESLAREIFGSPAEAMGQYIAARPDPPVWKEIIGIAADVRDDGMDEPAPALVYWPQVTLGFWEGNAADQIATWPAAGIAIRSGRLGTPGFVSDVEQAVWAVNSNLPLYRARPLQELVTASMARTSFAMILLGVAGLVSLVLGLVGVYGVISYSVSQRSRELGMRMALGAEASRVSGMVVRQGVILAGTGIAVGLGLAVGVTRFMSSILNGVNPVDPTTFGAVALGLLLVATAASYLPARRAARVDPMDALRAD